MPNRATSWKNEKTASAIGGEDTKRNLKYAKRLR